MPRVYSYLRFSTDRQVHGDSTRRQIAASRAWCDRKGLVLDESLRLADLGVSAYKGKNVREGALKGFLDQVEAGRIPRGSFLIVESLDRLSREQVPDALQLFIAILNAGITLVTLTPEREHTRESINDPIGLFEPILIMSRANEESAMKSARTLANWDQKRKTVREGKSMGNHCPWWIVAEEGKFRLHPERAEVIRRMYQARADGETIPDIQRWMNAEGIAGRFSKTWNASSVKHVLTARTVIGEYQPRKRVAGKLVDDGPPVESYYPAAVSLDLWHQAQKVCFVRGKGSDTFVNIFKGLVYAPDLSLYRCHVQTKVNKDGSKKVWRRMMSSAAIDQVPGADQNRAEFFSFERGFLAGMRELKPSDFVRDKDKDDLSGKLAKVSGALAEIDHKVNATKARIKKSPDIETLFDLLGELEADRRVLQVELAALQDRASSHEMETVGDLQSLSTVLESAPEEEQRALRLQIRVRLRSLIKAVYLTIEETGKRGRFTAWEARNFVVFQDGSVRFFCHDDTGKVVHNMRYLDDKFDYIAAFRDPDVERVSVSRVKPVTLPDYDAMPDVNKHGL